MKIGIDVSQLAYRRTGVSEYLRHLVDHMLEIDKENQYILFFSSLRQKISDANFPGLPAVRQTRNKSQNSNPNLQIKSFKIPPIVLDLLWNRLHILPIEWLIGQVDVFITSDWTEPPTHRAKKATILYDLIVYKYPQETDKRIVSTQKRKLEWVKKESDIIFCISESTKKDAMEILGMDEEKLHVLYPGVRL